MMDTDLLSNLIVGRVDPHIYAFSTETIPNYLKIGDTYRPVLKRLDEWRRYFPDLKQRYVQQAKVCESAYFRDYAVHQFLEYDRGRARWQRKEAPAEIYFSNEFFRDATEEDIKLAIADINDSYKKGLPKYAFYALDNGRIPIEVHYERTESFAPRPNQQETIERFKQALSKGRSNLLMYAVMRFGKSFTAMCCAVEMEASLVVVVSAKADVKAEWKRTVESHIKFANYTFLDSDTLLQSEDKLEHTLQEGNAVLFLTLQDLAGSEIKVKHRSLFESNIDLLLIDESHYGARAEEYGRVLRLSKKEAKTELQDIETADAYEQSGELKALNARVRIHLSGTPYRILMSSEFSEEDIIAFYQFSDIIEEQAEWDRQHLASDEVKEWDNPYYGFPQMVRFAFHPNEASRAKLATLREEGFSTGLSELFRPCSIAKDNKENAHRKFVHQREVGELLQAIDGSAEDKQILALLDLKEIQQGKMCRHMVFVLPYRASCDAMEVLLGEQKNLYHHLGEYRIINIAGLDAHQQYPTTESVRAKIEQCEADDIKTITLTVNRMLTGSTVKEWDTMIYLKDSASPQEYDQAVFRLQNQYVRTLTSDNRTSIKYNMKPQTLLVDFDPDRLFRLQEQRSQIYNANTEQRGNEELRSRIERELAYSPIVTIGAEGLQRVTSADVMNAVRAYSANRSVMDEATDIPVDYHLLDDEHLKEAISQLSPIDASKGIEIRAVEGEEAELELQGEDSQTEATTSAIPTKPNDQATTKEARENWAKKLATYYAQILFYAFLTEGSVSSLSDIIQTIEASEDNRRIARHVGLKLSILKLLHQKSNIFSLRGLDYKIENLNSLMRDDSLSPMKRVEVALAKFGRLSSSEVVTPQVVALEMINALGDEAISSTTKILDVASKQGEFTRAFIMRYGLEIGNRICALPTSSVSYEFTRKVYTLLGLDVRQVISHFTTYDLLNSERKETLIQQLIDMNFDLVIGNPPYQQNIAIVEGNKSLSKQLYPKFLEKSINITKRNVVLITPSRWFVADGQDNSFPSLRNFIAKNNHVRKILSYNGKSLFSNTELGDVAILVWDRFFQGDVLFEEHFEGLEVSSMSRPLFENGIDMILPMNNFVAILKKVIGKDDFISINAITTGRDVFGIPGKGIELKTSEHPFGGAYEVLCAKEKVRYISPSDLKRESRLINLYKVFISKANGGAGLLTDNKSNSIIGKSFVANPNVVCTDSLIAFGGYTNELEAQNLSKYLSTKFLRFMVGILKVSQNLYQNVYRFVPLQDFTEQSDIAWSKSTEEIDQQLYAKYGLSEEEIAFIEGKIKAMK